MKHLRLLSFSVTVVSLAISAALLYYCFSKIDWRTLYAVTLQASYGLLAVVVVVNFIVILLKAIRFKYVLNRPDVSILHANNALLVGFCANNIFPARIGEIARAIWINRFTKKGLVDVVGGVAVDHILEGAGLCLLLVFLVFRPDTARHFVMQSLWIVGLCLGLTLFLIILSFVLKKNARVDANSPPPKKGLRAHLVGFLSFVALSPTRAILLILFSGFIWFFQIFFLALIEQAFGLAWNPTITGLVLLGVNLAIAAPSAPAGIGPFEFAAFFIYTHFGIPKETALAVAITYHMIQVIPVTLVGLLIIGRSGLKQFRNTALRKESLSDSTK